MKYFIATFLIPALMFTFAASDAQARGRGKGKHRGHGIEKILKKLDLNEQQKVKIKKLEEDRKLESGELHKKMKELKKQMRSQWESESPNEDKIISLHRKIHALKGQLSELRLEFKIDVYKVLTPTQRTKAKTFLKQRHERREERHGIKDKQGKQGKCGKHRRHNPA